MNSKAHPCSYAWTVLRAGEDIVRYQLCRQDVMRGKDRVLETVTGYVEHIVFRNEENGYTVFHLENDDGEVTCVGNFSFISEGEMLELTGEYVNHNVYGTQLKVISHITKEPEDLVSIERYLGSGAIKGVGAALAGRIVKKFKKDTFRIIEEEPERLAEIKGISERKACEIAVQVEEKKDMRKAMIYLQKYGISTKLAAKIYQYYGMRVYKVLEENPYQLAIILRGSDSRRPTRSRRGSGYIQIQTTGLKADCSTRFSRR